MECKGTRSESSLAFTERLADAPETVVASPSGRSFSSLSSRLYWLRLVLVSPDPDVELCEENGERRIELRFFRCIRMFSRGAMVGRQPDSTSTAGSTTIQLHFDVLSESPGCVIKALNESKKCDSHMVCRRDSR